MPDRHTVLIVDDDPPIREMLSDFLKEEGYDTLVASDGASALHTLRHSAERINLALLDMRLPDVQGLEILRAMAEKGMELPVIVMTAHGTSSTAIHSMQLGAYDYLTKPIDLNQLGLTIRRLLEHHALAQQVKSLQTKLNEYLIHERIVGSSPAMQEVYKLIGRVAASDATVLISGETGSGKELVAEAIHENSARADQPLIKVNCAALPETLLESELFGHEKGSFTGAVTQRKGRFELASGGTIFLDEVGEMSPNTQKKLLRVLQFGEFQRVGGSEALYTDVRVIAATNKNLEREVEEGRFRDDLYYRLNVIRIPMPPLRERREDIPLLIAHFLDRYRYRPGVPPTKISEEALRLLMDYSWPGNVRQLENTIERAVVLAQGKLITAQHVALDSPLTTDNLLNITQRVRARTALAAILEDVEHLAVEIAVTQARGDREEAARMLGLPARELEAKLRALGARRQSDLSSAAGQGEGEAR
ncbi:MAG TPA: sigma-54 dependent transcriptional regulator [Anaerolineae bacterium]|nr:sigma-54 dependent transcriptional regulator [Anaerolineae bacterium]HOR00236.1 sigma-54 dependent transcriptional regulator [Anaerolineae bacterium]HPL28033.1 sigma-54 dependent transcriptional regulator [Anaerolineae bacterium]